MKPFNLEEYLANPNKKMVTRNGRNARIICTDRKNEDFPIVALIKYENQEYTLHYTKEGRFDFDIEHAADLFFVPEKKEGWINIYHGKDGPIVGNVIFTSKEEAEESKRHCCGFTQGLYLTTAKIEWEE